LGRAWSVTRRKTFAYTNHTLLPEALERWSLEVFGTRAAAASEIIYDINALPRRGAHPLLGDEAAPRACR
jgi:glucan phosphorylase